MPVRARCRRASPLPPKSSTLGAPADRTFHVASPSSSAARFLNAGSHLQPPPFVARSNPKFSIKTKIGVMSFLRLLPRRLPQFVRQMEQDVETVINVLQPGPIGIVEQKFTDAEIHEARATVRSAVDNWRRNWTLERNLGSDSFEKWK